MKTQIIQLEAHDDHISIRDKMNWSKTPRILLILPRRRNYALNTLDLKLLQRHAASLGAELGLVTKSSETIRVANELKIPVFENNLAAQRKTWRKRKHIRRKKRKKHKNLRSKRDEFQKSEAEWRTRPLTRLGFFTLATLALFSLIFAFFPQAQIEIEPTRRIQSLTIPVRANLNVDKVFLSGSIPAYELRVNLTHKRSLIASGRVAIPAQVARGSVIFRNLTDNSIKIPAGTVIRSIEDAEIRFITLYDAEIAGEIDAEVEAPVKSLIFGERGNLAPDLLQAIEGELSLSLAATNPSPTEGGVDNFVSAPTKRDREELRDLVMAYFYKETEDDLKKELEEGVVVFPDSWTDMEILEELYAPPEGETGDELTLTMRISRKALYAKESDLAELAKSALAASAPSGFTPLPETLAFSPASDFETSHLGTTSWQMRVEQELRPNITLAEVIALTQGHSAKVAAENLQQNLDLDNAPKITIAPSWWKWLPLAPFRINLLVK